MSPLKVTEGGGPAMSDSRSSVPAATQAALWVLSNGNCYAPGCSLPVIHEVRPGVFKKNAQIAHIYGVKAPRKNTTLSVEQRESFANLMLLCLAHHSEIDDKNYGEKRYPADVLLRWKADHEGSDQDALAIIKISDQADEELLFDHLSKAFEPPLKRLEAIASQLEKTGTLTASSMVELQQVVRVLGTSGVGVNSQTASALANAADILSAIRISEVASQLAHFVDVIPGMRLDQTATRLADAADRLGNSRGSY
nr:hypothetical protein [Pseudonocardia sp. AL041005-10]